MGTRRLVVSARWWAWPCAQWRQPRPRAPVTANGAPTRRTCARQSTRPSPRSPPRISPISRSLGRGAPPTPTSSTATTGAPPSRFSPRLRMAGGLGTRPLGDAAADHPIQRHATDGRRRALYQAAAIDARTGHRLWVHDPRTYEAGTPAPAPWVHRGPEWADRTVTGCGCSRPLSGHAHPSRRRPNESPMGNDRQFETRTKGSVNLWVRPPHTGTHQCHVRDADR